MQWFGLEGTFKGHLGQDPCNEKAHLQLDQVAQSPVRPDLEGSQGWGIYHLSGQPVPVFHHPHCKKCLPYVCYPLGMCRWDAVIATGGDAAEAGRW